MALDFDELKTQIDSQYEQALAALEVLKKFAQSTSQNNTSQKRPQKQKKSQRDLVLEILDKHGPSTVEEISEKCDLTKQQIRGVLYAKALATMIKSEVINGIARYKTA